MNEAELKAERNKEAICQEQNEVKAQRDKGNVAYRISREIDTICFDKPTGILWVTDCKATKNGEDVFYVDSSDVNKGLDVVLGIQETLGRYGVPVQFRIDMFFRRHRSNNHKYILITECDRGHTIKIIRGKKRITTSRV